MISQVRFLFAICLILALSHAGIGLAVNETDGGENSSPEFRKAFSLDALKHFVIFTRKQPSGVQLDAGKTTHLVKRKTDTVVVTHGFKLIKSDIEMIVKTILNQDPPMNVIWYPWTLPPKYKGLEAVQYALSQGRRLGSDLLLFAHLFQIRPDQFTLVGFKAGTYLMRTAAKKFNSRVGLLIGVDPNEAEFKLVSPVRKGNAIVATVLYRNEKKLQSLLKKKKNGDFQPIIFPTDFHRDETNATSPPSVTITPNVKEKKSDKSHSTTTTTPDKFRSDEKSTSPPDPGNSLVLPEKNNSTPETPSTTQKAPSTTQKAPSTTQKAPSITQKAPSITQKAPSITQKAPSITQKASSTTQKAPSTTQKASSSTPETEKQTDSSSRSTNTTESESGELPKPENKSNSSQTVPKVSLSQKKADSNTSSDVQTSPKLGTKREISNDEAHGPHSSQHRAKKFSPSLWEDSDLNPLLLFPPKRPLLHPDWDPIPKVNSFPSQSKGQAKTLSDDPRLPPPSQRRPPPQNPPPPQRPSSSKNFFLSLSDDPRLPPPSQRRPPPQNPPPSQRPSSPKNFFLSLSDDPRLSPRKPRKFFPPLSYPPLSSSKYPFALLPDRPFPLPSIGRFIRSSILSLRRFLAKLSNLPFISKLKYLYDLSRNPHLPPPKHPFSSLSDHPFPLLSIRHFIRSSVVSLTNLLAQLSNPPFKPPIKHTYRSSSKYRSDTSDDPSPPLSDDSSPLPSNNSLSDDPSEDPSEDPIKLNSSIPLTPKSTQTPTQQLEHLVVLPKASDLSRSSPSIPSLTKNTGSFRFLTTVSERVKEYMNENVNENSLRRGHARNPRYPRNPEHPMVFEIVMNLFVKPLSSAGKQLINSLQGTGSFREASEGLLNDDDMEDEKNQTNTNPNILWKAEKNELEKNMRTYRDEEAIEVPPVTETNETPPVTEANETLPVTEANETSPVTEANETLPVTEANETLPVTEAFAITEAFTVMPTTQEPPTPGKRSLSPPFEVKLLVHTQENPDGVPIDLKEISPAVKLGKKTVIVTHGSDLNITKMTNLAKEHLHEPEIENVLTVNWSRALNPKSRKTEETVHELIQKYIRELNTKYKINPDDIDVLGPYVPIKFKNENR